MGHPVTRNVPNILSAYRIVAFPFILFFIWSGREQLFTIFLCINLITDILDGLIARTFKLETEFGAKLDSMADVGTYLAAFIGVLAFKFSVIQPYILPFYLFVALLLATYATALFKFKRLMSFHLYSSKIGGYFQGIWFFTVFAFGFWLPYYYFMLIWGMMSFVEHIIIQMIIKEPKSNVKGLYWVLKERKK